MNRELIRVSYEAKVSRSIAPCAEIPVIAAGSRWLVGRVDNFPGRPLATKRNLDLSQILPRWRAQSAQAYGHPLALPLGLSRETFHHAIAVLTAVARGCTAVFDAHVDRITAFTALYLPVDSGSRCT